ncbi:hypothetical protein ABFS82_05G023000 [Erythranthe guttata]
MIKQILGKIPRKHSKSAGESNFSASSSLKRGDGGTTTTTTTISAPYSAFDIANNSNLKVNNNSRSSNENSVVPTSYEALPSFKDVPTSERQHLFVSKAKMCCVRFDFTVPTKNLREKDLKRQILLELVEYVASANEKFTENLMLEVVKMVSANIFRDFAPRPRENNNILLNSLDFEDEEPHMDPAWSHLQVVYELLLRFIISPETDAKIAKRFIDHSFVMKLLHLFDSEIPSEREYLKSILHRIYGKFMVHRPFIRKTINNIFTSFVFEEEKHNGIAEFLEVFGSIINGFALPLKEEHKLFLVRTLIPLHKPKCLAMYHHQLSYCVTQFVEKDFKLADIVVRGLIKYWPVTNSTKELLFLNELEEVLEATHASEFQRCMVPLFREISSCLNSLHFQVAEIALLLWNNDHIENLIKQNRKVILPIIFPSLERNARQHWNQSVRSLTLNVRKVFYDIDPDLFEVCQIRFQEDESMEKEIEEKRESTWKLLEELASKKVVSNEAILVHSTTSAS